MENEFTNKGIAILYKKQTLTQKPATCFLSKKFSADEIKTLNQN
jgi:hypothetical protein